MNIGANTERSAFSWNAGGWFGTQFGCTLWLLILGVVLISRGSLLGWACIASFVVLNVWGSYLWRHREQLGAYTGLQRFLFPASLIIAVIVVVVNRGGVSEPPAPGALVSTYLPYWVIVFAPALMLLFYVLERNAKRRLG